MFIETVKSLSAHKDCNHNDLSNRLKEISEKSRKDFFYSRWLGNNISKALHTGIPSGNPSPTSIPRAIPIALFFNDLEKILFTVEKHSKITHMSPLSLAGTFFVSFMLFFLKKGKTDPDKIMENAFMEMEKKYPGIKPLSEKIELVLNGKIENISEARKLLGTGSVIYQSLPLALYIQDI